MTVDELINSLGYDVVNSPKDPSQEVTGGYASDLLSCVMAGADAGNVWVTLQSHPNVVAVAVLLELPLVIITEGAKLEEEAVEKAKEEGIGILSTRLTTYAVVGRLWGLGIPAAEKVCL